MDPQSPIVMTGYQIRDPKIKKIFFSRGPGLGQDVGDVTAIEGVNPQLGIKYILPKEFLNSQMIASQVQFQNVTDQPLFDFVLTEVHHLNGKKLQEFKFDLGFVPPQTQNSWEHIYQPEFKRSDSFIKAAMQGPWDVLTTLSIGGKEVMRTAAKLTFK